jgi:hypothetical protein
MMREPGSVLGKDGVRSSILRGGTTLSAGILEQFALCHATRHPTKWREVAEHGVNLPESYGENPGTRFPIRSPNPPQGSM